MTLRIVLPLVTLFSFNAFASNSNLYSDICKKAKSDGFVAAKQFAKESNVFVSKHANNFYCNGVALKDYAKQKSVTVATQPAKVVYAADGNAASQLCVKATKGNLKALSRRTQKVKSLTCNGQPVEDFIKQVNSAI